MPIKYTNGLKMKVTCHRCNSKVDATIYQERLRWIAHTKCPHQKKVMGFVNDPDILEKRGVLSSDDSARRKHDRDKEEKRKEQLDRLQYHNRMQDVSTGKKYY